MIYKYLHGTIFLNSHSIKNQMKYIGKLIVNCYMGLGVVGTGEVGGYH